MSQNHSLIPANRFPGKPKVSKISPPRTALESVGLRIVSITLINTSQLANPGTANTLGTTTPIPIDLDETLEIVNTYRLFFSELRNSVNEFQRTFETVFDNQTTNRPVMARKKTPVTPAIRALRAAGVPFSNHSYRYETGGGTRVSARELAVDEHAVIKTLIMQNENNDALIVLMHGDREVSTKALAREVGLKMVRPCDPAGAELNSGYQVGGTSPFGTRKSMPVYCESSILELPLVYINGGARGYLVSLDPKELVRVLKPTLVNVQR